MPAHLPNRGKAALLRSAVMALAAGAVALPAATQACAVWSKEDEARLKRVQDRWLHKETDLTVRGTFAEEPLRHDENEEAESYEYVGRSGMIIAEDGRRYSIFVPLQIGCDFGHYSVEDSEKGLFYLRRDEDPVETDNEDRADGVIDNYQLIYFRPDEGK
jgi:hypothetical protein